MKYDTENKIALKAELQKLKPYDEVQIIEEESNGTYFIYTAGHGYLAVPKGSKNAKVAKQVLEASGYGYEGPGAYYLEEDCEAPKYSYLVSIKALKQEV